MAGYDNVVMDADLPSRTVRVFHWDDVEGSGGIEDKQDVTSIAEAVKAVGREGFNKKAMFRPIASIPTNIWQQLKDKWNALGLSKEERQQALKAFLNDRDNSIWKYDPSFKV